MMILTIPHPGSGACREGPDVCAVLLTLTSILIIVITIPLSLLWSIKVVQVGLQPLVCIVTTSAANRLIGEVVQSINQSLMIIVSGTQFHIYLPWGQRLFSIVS